MLSSILVRFCEMKGFLSFSSLSFCSWTLTGIHPLQDSTNMAPSTHGDYNVCFKLKLCPNYLGHHAHGLRVAPTLFRIQTMVQLAPLHPPNNLWTPSYRTPYFSVRLYNLYDLQNEKFWYY